MKVRYIASLLVTVLSLASLCFGQSSGTLRGVVTLGNNGSPLHDVSIQIVQLKRTVETDDNGAYEFNDVPTGTYTVLAHMDGVPDLAKMVTVIAPETKADFILRLSGPREQVTVTASG